MIFFPGMALFIFVWCTLDKGPHTVFLTSLVYEAKPDEIVMVASRRLDATRRSNVFNVSAEGGVVAGGAIASERYRLTFPRLPGSYTGAGDLCAALLLAWCYRTHAEYGETGELSEAFERVGATMRAVLQRTNAENVPPGKIRELRLVQSKADIETPIVEFRAERIVVSDSDGYGNI